MVIKFCFLILFPVFFFTASRATTYYVSVAGNDANSGTSPEQSWKSLEKVNDFSPLPGDQILFNRGDEWLGSIKVNSSGTPDNPIVFGAYGSGEKPVISGLVELRNWEYSENGIYKSKFNFNNDVNLLVINGHLQHLGRFPNTGYLSYEKVDNTISVIDRELPDIPDWSGAEMVIKNNNWTISRNKITGHSNGKITYDAGTNYVPRLGESYGYFFQKDIRTLDRFGEWYCNGSEMNVFFGNENPEDYIVQTSIIDTIMIVNNQNNITIENLNIQGSNKLSIYSKQANNLTVRFCDIELSGTDAVYLQESCANSIIQGNQLIKTNGIGIEVGNTNNVTIIENTIKGTGLYAGMGRSKSGYQAVSLNCKNAIVEENIIDSAGYNGISFYINYINSIVNHNLIKHTNQLITDGSAIYMWEVNSNTISDDSGIEISGNIILNCGSNAIYSDGYVNNVRMFNNTIAFGAKGIHMNQPRQNTIENNILYMNSNRAISMQNLEEEQIKVNARDNTIRNNTFVGNDNQGDKIYQLADGKGDSILSFGYADLNYFLIPFKDYPVVTYSVKDKLTSESRRDTLTIKGWRKTLNFDKNSEVMITTTDELFFEYNASKQNKTISLPCTMYDVKGNAYEETVTIEPFASIVLSKKNNSIH